MFQPRHWRICQGKKEKGRWQEREGWKRLRIIAAKENPLEFQTFQFWQVRQIEKHKSNGLSLKLNLLHGSYLFHLLFTIPGSPTHWPNNEKVRLLSIVSIHAIHPLLQFLFHSSNKYSVLWSRNRESWFLGANPICPKIPFNHTPMAGGYCVAPLIGAKGLDEQKPGFI